MIEKKSILKKIYLSVAGIVFAGLLLWFILATGRFDSGHAVNDASTYTVKRGNLVISVLESGNLKARYSLDIRSEVEGTTTIISIVAEGTLITEADVNLKKVLIELDSSLLRDNATQHEILLNQAKSDFGQAEENLNIQLKQNDSDIKSGELTLKFARMDLEKYLGAAIVSEMLPEGEIEFRDLVNRRDLGGEALQQNRNFQSEIELAKEEVTLAQNKLNWTRELFSKGYVTRDELEADRLSLKRKNVELEKSHTALDLFLKYDFAKETEKLISAELEAQRELERIIARARSMEIQARADWESKKLNYELQLNKFQKLKDQIEKCTIRATQPGLVVYAGGGDMWRRRQEPIEEGATVRERQQLITLPDLSVMAVDVKVIESAVEKVKKGQKAIIRLDAFPDMPLSGYVNKIALVPDSQASWLNPDLKVYSSEVVIDGRNLKNLKPGLTAAVEIISEKLTDVIVVPVQAVFPYDGRSVCYVVKRGYYEARPVLLGNAGESFIHILKGLVAGEDILLREPGPGERVQAVPASFTVEKPEISEMPGDDIRDGKKPGPVPAGRKMNHGADQTQTDQ
ncbi:MAG: efflux RND transporter periplasmic adaptor subunit [Desulfobacterales bacterium]|nr:efflux RND transporter periplasmic adaptor subunit [Desulfobacterales bacterium]MDD4071585.1 efflux RND transporter periplasmic adaptor subunit [Desulfobacterales bacterium]MDD4391575.1 efflux RND transporter periplasmic adaptor subunit [Desulfobacterales bacterium]